MEKSHLLLGPFPKQLPSPFKSYNLIDVEANDAAGESVDVGKDVSKLSKNFDSYDNYDDKKDQARHL